MTANLALVASKPLTNHGLKHVIVVVGPGFWGMSSSAAELSTTCLKIFGVPGRLVNPMPRKLPMVALAKQNHSADDLLNLRGETGGITGVRCGQTCVLKNMFNIKYNGKDILYIRGGVKSRI